MDQQKPGMGALAQYVANLPWGAESPPAPPVRVEITGKHGYDVRALIVRSSAADQKLAEQELSKLLPQELIDQLVDGEDRLFAWLKRDPVHPTRFALDPLACLVEAGIKLDPQVLQALARHREGQRRLIDPTALNNLERLRIEVAKKS